MIIYFKYYFYHFFYIFFKLMRMTKYFENEYGIKCLNKKKFDYNKLEKYKHEIFLDSSQLYLGFDSLNDTYTLIDSPISQSPHFDLMKTISNISGNNICEVCNSDYYYREICGMLDGRLPLKPGKKILNCHLSKYNEMIKLIENDDYRPVYIYKMNKKNYIFDGKHRAALCSYFGKKVKCIEISNDVFTDDEYTWAVYNCMTKNEKNFSKNIEHLKKLLVKQKKSQK